MAINQRKDDFASARYLHCTGIQHCHLRSSTIRCERDTIIAIGLFIRITDNKMAHTFCTLNNRKRNPIISLFKTFVSILLLCGLYVIEYTEECGRPITRKINYRSCIVASALIWMKADALLQLIATGVLYEVIVEGSICDLTLVKILRIRGIPFKYLFVISN
ncbi:hypothetical protein PUN28_015909 [Cardiocondyla obscurior]|uniref:Uncharacterized protein n=1 Tax=Cardiocondyla obscurior TaxID=286306 RepID=A0AAW2ERS1_9HYME